MKIIKLLATIAIFILFTASCGNSDEKASEKIAEKIIENATGNKIDVDVDKNGDKRSITLKGDNGEDLTISSNGNEIPNNFPKDIFLAKGEIVSVGTINNGEVSIFTIVINAKEEIGKISEKISNEMKARGWKSEMNMTTGEGGMQMYSKNDNSITITIGKDNDQTQVNYMATVSKK